VRVESLYEAHRPALVRYLARFCGDPDLAEDAAQEAFVRLAERPPARDENLRAWLFTVATRIAVDQARARRRREGLLEARPDDPALGDPPDPPDEALDRARLRRHVRAALDGLDEKERTVLLMREEGFAHREIAAAVGTTTGSVGTMIARALRKLADRLPPGIEAA
jgi:RNA polymerase sigma-70 factor (ECF subfamily)